MGFYHASLLRMLRSKKSVLGRLYRISFAAARAAAMTASMS